MRTKIDLRKVGNHWYPCIDHFDPNDISLDLKMERMMNIMDIFESGHVSVYLTKIKKQDNKTTIQFDENDIVKYLTTDEDFFMNVYIGDRHFWIHSMLYYLLEQQFNFNFHNTLYKFEIW